MAALARVDEHGEVVDPLAEQQLDLLVPHHLFEDRAVGRAEDELGLAGDLLAVEREPAVAVHRVGDVDEQRVRHGVAAVRDERVDDLLGVVPSGPGVPQAERGDPVGVDVFGRSLQLGEGRDGPPRLLRALVVDLEQQRLCRSGR